MKKALPFRACSLSVSTGFFLRIRGLFPVLIFFFFLSTAIRAQPDWSWLDHVNTSQDEWVNDIAVDTVSGNAVAVGIFNSDISSFYGSNFTAANGGGFVVKYDPSGSVLWAFRIGNNQDDACTGVAIDETGGIYVTGYFENIADFRGTSATSAVLSSSGLRDVFVAKYNDGGQLLWVKTGGGAGNDEGKAVCVNYNKVFVTGHFNQSATFGSLSTPVVNANDNAFVTAYDLSGNELWLSEIGSNQVAYGKDIAADSNNVFFTGIFKAATISVYNASGAVAFTVNNSVPGQDDAYLVSFTAGGAGVWGGSVHSSSEDVIHSITQKNGNLYLAGSVSSAADFPGYASNPFTLSGNGKEIFIAAVTKSAGVTSWVKTEPGSNGDQEALSITTGPFSELYVCGYFTNSVTFSGTATLVSAGSEDVFVSVYNTSGAFQRIYQGGSAGADRANALTADTDGIIYTGGSYEDAANFGTFSAPDFLLRNIFVGQIACLPVVNTIDTSQTICEGSTPAMLTGNNPTGGMSPFSYLWEESADNITWTPAGGINNLINYSPPAVSVTVYYRRTATSGGVCSNSTISASITITVDQSPGTANAGTDQIICGDSASFSATPAAVGAGVWTVASGTGVFEIVNSDTSAVTGLTYGTNTFVWTLNNGVCPASSDTVMITAQQAPAAADAGPDFSVCSDSALLNAVPPTAGTGTWVSITAGPLVNSPSSPNSSVNSLVSGANSFEWTITNGICPPRKDTVVVTVDALPSAADAGADQIFCGDSTQLSGNTPAIGIGTWTFDSGSGNFQNINSGTSSVTNLFNGINVLAWTISNGSCPPTSDTVIVRAFTMPTVANAGPDQNVCDSTSSLSANTAVSGTGSWSVITAGPSVASPFSATSAVTNLIIGANQFVWKITNGVCPESTDTIVINVDVPPSVANAGTDQTVCGDSALLNANTPAVGNGTWSVSSGAGNFASANAPLTNVNTLGVGINSLVWTISNGACAASSDTVIINSFAPVTVSNAGADQAVCTSSVTLNANNPASGTGNWNVISGGVIGSPSNPSAVASSLQTGQNSFEWIISNGVCPDSRDTVAITVDENPSAASAGSDQNVCGDSLALSGNVPAIGTGTWSVISGSGNFQNSNLPTAVVTSLSNGMNSLVWTISNGACPSSADTVMITTYPQVTAASAGNDTAVCAITYIINANSPASGTGSWTILTPGSSLTSMTSSNPLAILINGQNQFVWSVSNGVCPVSRDTLTITSDAAPTAAAAGSDQTVCGDSAMLNANLPANGNGTWSVYSGNGTFANVQLNASAVTALDTGLNVFVWTIASGACPSSSDTVKITSYNEVTSSAAGPDQAICASSALLNANFPSSGSGTWNIITPGPVLSSNTNPFASASSLVTGQNLFEWIISNGVCPNSRDTVSVTVDAMPSPANAGADFTVCGSNTILSASAPSVGNGAWTSVSGSVIFAPSNAATSAVSNLAAGLNALIWTISNGVCPSSADTVIVTSIALPSVANAGVDQQICDSTAQLNANTPVSGTGSWTILTAGVQLSSLTSPSASATSLSAGPNQFIWIISNANCPPSADTVTVQVDAPPSAANAGPDIVTQLSSAQLAANTPLYGAGNWSIIAGSGTLSNSNDPLSVIENLSDESSTIVVWTVTSGMCGASSDTVMISREDLYIPEVITPNGDGLNDYFEVRAYKGVSGLKLQLFNRWGGIVFSTDNYQNNFDGSNADGVALPEDTYFYVIETKENKTYNGYVVIKRK